MAPTIKLLFRPFQKIHLATADQCSHQKILSHRRRPVPMAELGPGLRREDNEGASQRIIRMHPSTRISPGRSA